MFMNSFYSPCLYKVKHERGWRDIEFSCRHKLWGFGCPTVDIDLLIIEYDRAEPKAIIEYKNEHSRFVNFNNANYRAISSLCNSARIPFFNCYYATDFSWFDPTPLNKYAKDVLPDPVSLSEIDFVRFLYDLRNSPFPAELENILNGKAPWAGSP